MWRLAWLCLVVACGSKRGPTTAPAPEPSPDPVDVQPEKPPSVGLIGVRMGDELRTLRVNQAGLAPAGFGVAMAREGGLWRLQVVPTRRLDVQLEALLGWQLPGQRPSAPPIDPSLTAPDAYQRSTVTVQFVGPDKVGYIDAGTSYQGGAHSTHWDTYVVSAWPGEGKAGVKGTMIDSVLGESARALLLDAWPDGDACYAAMPSAWTPVHYQGAWVIRGSAVAQGPACPPRLEVYDVDVEVSASLVGTTFPVASWNDWYEGRGDLRDVVVGPGGEAVLIYPERIVLERDGAAVATLPWAGARVVSEAWTTDAQEMPVWEALGEP